MEMITICIIAALLIAALFALSTTQRQRAKAENQLNEARIEIAKLHAQLSVAAKLQEASEKRIAELNEQSKETFKNIANDLLKKNTQELKATNDIRMEEILRPFNDNITNIRNSIKNYYENGLKETSSLKTTIEELSKLNSQLGKEASQLSTALRGNQKNTQGPWGEMILKQILENSGLIEGTNFALQATHNADGTKIDERFRPDALLYIPEHKVLVIDSKVNITAFTEYANADNDDDRKRLLTAHVKAVETQINNLSDKGYQKAVKNSADFVIMFMPNEAAYLAAMHGDSDLWLKAYNKHVLLVSPTHLISVVKMIEQLWNNDKQNKNAIKIAEESGKLIDKLAGFVKDLEDVGNSIQKANKSYDEAMKKLRDGNGNILRRADNIRELGAKATKSLPI